MAARKYRTREGVGGFRPVDVHVGGRLRLRRTLLGMSQEKLGEAVGLTFQQIQKYEKGANRVGASRLYQFSRILDIPISFFFDDMPGEDGRASAESDDNLLVRRETLELVRAYYRITDPKVRRAICNLIRTIPE